MTAFPIERMRVTGPAEVSAVTTSGRIVSGTSVTAPGESSAAPSDGTYGPETCATRPWRPS